MKLINILERKFGRYAISGLMRYIVILFLIGLAIGTFMPEVYGYYLALDFSMVAKGQIWRLITFLIPTNSIMGSSFGILLLAITIYIYYSFGTSLENVWGSFRLNLYFFSGIIFNIVAYWITSMIAGPYVWYSCISTVCETLFFAYAAVYPNMTIFFNFLIPVKAKYLALFFGAYYVYDIYQAIISHYYVGIIPIVASLANFLIFFLLTRNYRRISPGEIKRKATYRRQVKEGKNQGNVTQFRGRNVITRHKCAVCGRTELDNDQLEFRFCSKCDGNYEYCMDHLFTHEHVHQD